MRYSLLGNWMLTYPTTNAMWYDKLSTSSDNDSLFENLNLATDGYSDVECLVRKEKVRKSTQALAVEACDRNHTAICRLDLEQIHPLADIPKFPCLTPKPTNRRKRSHADEDHLKRDNKKGLLHSNIFMPIYILSIY